MSRLGMVASLFLALGCTGRDSMPQKPQLFVDRDTIGFGTEFGNATYVGTSPQESLLIKNMGLDNLVISSVDKSGDAVFTLEGPLSNELKGKESTFIRVFFTPTTAKA